MAWIIAAVVVGAVLALTKLVWLPKRRKKPSDFATPQSVGPERFESSTRIKGPRSGLSAAEMLSRIGGLRDGDAQWDAIWSELNPMGDPEVQRLLVEIRGPHMFVPHLGLSVIEDGCRRVLAVSPEADALAALREAIRSQDPFVR